MRYLLFLLAFIAVADWAQVWLFIMTLLRPTVKKTKIKDKALLNFIKNKAGFEIKQIVKIESNKMYGGMSGIPGRPIMMLSSELLKTLSKDELEYVLLHESGHFKYYHPVIIVCAQVFSIAVGLYISIFISPFLAFLLGVVIALAFIQIARRTETAAENFAASHLDNPEAMISAVNKFEAHWGKSQTRILKSLSWNISYDKKREIAKKYVK